MREAKAIRASITALCAAAVKLQDRVHELALECLAHASEHGDATLINELYRGLPSGQRTESLKQWAETFSPIRFKADGGVGMLKQDAPNYTAFDLATAEATPYYIKPETVAKPLTLAQLMKLAEGLPDRVTRAQEKGTIAEGEDVGKMMAFAEAVKATAANQLPA